jgi:type IV fimbrial biogenesis protein FimT
MSRHTRSGFTLVEVMIVLAVIGVLAGLAAPSLLNTLPGLRVNGASRQVLADLRMARTQAVEKGKSVVVKFHVDSTGSSSAGTYVLAFDNNADNDLTPSTAPNDAVITEVTLARDYSAIEFASNVSGTPSNGIDLSNAAIGDVANAITFRPNGSASESGDIYLRIVGATGNVRIETWNGTAWE